ncbi:MAG TPA: amidohydrolase family protein [Myxococcota bacterium]|jgi:N-acyl-D-aspartate/D-glutamate deacylase|nr:amidohydrolase family protein [Myxococcota bacterium]
MLDLAIRGGTIADGTGAAPRRGDVGVAGGRIVALGRVDDPARRTLDAGGAVVAPGFIDLHTHYDAQVLWDRSLSISPWHGVTTVVMGNCGFSLAPTRPAHRDLLLRTLENVEGMSLEALRAGVGEDWSFETFPDYLDAIERRGVAANVGAFVGHTALRTYVLGDEATEREATPDEIARMRELVRGALDAGALGFATSKAPTHVGAAGRPVPSRAASVAEIESIAGALGDAGHGVLQATLGPGLFLDEFERIARATRRPVTFTALLAGMLGPTGHRAVLERCGVLQSEGVRVHPQVTPRPLQVEFQLASPLPFMALPFFASYLAADVEGKKALLRGEALRAAFRAQADRGRLGPGLRATCVVACAADPTLEERTLGELADARATHPVDVLFELALATDLEARFRMAVFNTDEAAVAELLTHPAPVLGLSDAGAHASQLCDAGLPTDLLGRWVREKGVLSLEQAVKRLTSEPAELLGLRDRGRIAEGTTADLVVFDPATVACSGLRRVHDFPGGADRLVADALGIRAVIVNGVAIREDGKDVLDPDGPLPGRVVRGGRA